MEKLPSYIGMLLFASLTWYRFHYRVALSYRWSWKAIVDVHVLKFSKNVTFELLFNVV